jgi:hypothetical protein
MRRSRARSPWAVLTRWPWPERFDPNCALGSALPRQSSALACRVRHDGHEPMIRGRCPVGRPSELCASDTGGCVDADPRPWVSDHGASRRLEVRVFRGSQGENHAVRRTRRSQRACDRRAGHHGQHPSPESGTRHACLPAGCKTVVACCARGGLIGRTARSVARLSQLDVRSGRTSRTPAT